MTDNSRRIIENIQASFPHLYNVYDKKTILYALLSIFGERLGMRTDIIDRLYAMIGIDSTYDEDLEHRWGSLLGMYKQENESYDNYRSRLLITYSSLAGGTAEAMKYAIASAIGIIDSTKIDTLIHIYDAWECPHEVDPTLLGISNYVDETSLYGTSICTIDLSDIANVNFAELTDTINQVKASGINAYLLFLYGIFEENATLFRNDINHDVLNIQSLEGAEFYEIQSSTAILGSMVVGRAILGNTTIDSVGVNKVDIFTDHIMGLYNEYARIDNINNLWSTIGTNSAILNESLVTNIYLETDECIDIIKYLN